MASEGLPARAEAAALLHGVLFAKRMLSDVLAERAEDQAALEPSERARALSSVRTCLRHLGPVDAVLDRFFEHAPPFRVRNILRLATSEMLVDGAPAHAAVNAGVQLVRSHAKTSSHAGLANAVLRRVDAEGAEVFATEGAQKLAKWLGRSVEKTYGPDILRAIEVAHAFGAPLDLTLKNPSDVRDLSEKLNAHVLPTDGLRLSNPGQISRLSGFDDGLWWVQDAAAALPVQMLGNLKGLDVLDMCAAPGGKTMQLAAGGANVMAVDSIADRLDRLRSNLSRVHLTANVVASDVFDLPETRRFDAILLDAPCSATGTIRRHPDLPFVKGGADLRPIFSVQKRMIDKALALLNPGGRLVYCVCSLLPREGEDQIADALQRHEGTMSVVANTNGQGFDPSWQDAQGGIRTRPDYWSDIGGMDGFYMAMLQKD